MQWNPSFSLYKNSVSKQWHGNIREIRSSNKIINFPRFYLPKRFVYHANIIFINMSLMERERMISIVDMTKLKIHVSACSSFIPEISVLLNSAQNPSRRLSSEKTGSNACLRSLRRIPGEGSGNREEQTLGFSSGESERNTKKGRW